MSWPIEIPFGPDAELTGTAFGHPLRFVHDRPTTMLSFAEEQWRVGLPPKTRALRFGPSLGTLPWLLFPSPALIVPAGQTLEKSFNLPLLLGIAAVAGAGGASTATRLRSLEAPEQTRSLYGPVDEGTLCRSVRDNAAWDRAVLSFAEESAPCHGVVRFRVTNQSQEPHEVARILVPVDMVGLYQATSGPPLLSEVTMTITSETEANLEVEPPAGAEPLHDVEGQALAPLRRGFAFSPSYRNRTGLEFGF